MIFNIKFSFKVEDRTDGKLVHLDGLNFSRAWGLYRFAETQDTKYRFPANMYTLCLHVSRQQICDDHSVADLRGDLEDQRVNG